MTDCDHLDYMISLGLLQKDKVERFWRNVQDIILDRMARKMLKHKPGAYDLEVQQYAEGKEPRIDIDHLN